MFFHLHIDSLLFCSPLCIFEVLRHPLLWIDRWTYLAAAVMLKCHKHKQGTHMYSVPHLYSRIPQPPRPLGPHSSYMATGKIDNNLRCVVYIYPGI